MVLKYRVRRMADGEAGFGREALAFLGTLGQHNKDGTGGAGDAADARLRGDPVAGLPTLRLLTGAAR
jgi:hypothetical protein